MERNTSLNHRISGERKNEFNLAFTKVQVLLLAKGINITKEDFLEALIVLASNSEKKIVGILENDVLEIK